MIGEIIRIEGTSLTVKMVDLRGKYTIVEDDKRYIGEIGSYVMISQQNKKIIGEIVSIDEYIAMVKLIGEVYNNKFHYGINKFPLLYQTIELIDYESLKIIYNLNPTQDTNNPNGMISSLAIGKSTVFSKIDVTIDIDKFFGFHFSVFGNTGSGKSNTIARIIQNIFSHTNNSAKGAKIVLLDSNGEYSSAFRDISKVNPDISVKFLSANPATKDTRLEIPVWALSADDWAILLNANNKNQLPVIKRAMDIAQVFYTSLISVSSAKLKNHILASTVVGIINSSDTSPSKIDKLTSIFTRFKTPELHLDQMVTSNIGLKQTLRVSIRNDNGQIKDIEAIQNYCQTLIIDDVSALFERERENVAIYDLNQFSKALELALLYEGSLSSANIQEYTTSLLTRIQALKDGENKGLFVKTNFKTIYEYIESILGDNQLLNIDVSSLDDHATEVVSKVLAKVLLDYLMSREEKASMPVNLILEEAHRYVKDQLDYSILGYNIFERIAKEGRKYGLLLGISSQRPSELSRTVVSQCSNFIIHRIQNPEDLKYVSKIVPYISENMIERLTFVPVGTALVFGEAINIPSYTRFSLASPQTDSLNAKIKQKWFL